MFQPSSVGAPELVKLIGNVIGDRAMLGAPVTSMVKAVVVFRELPLQA
jgi:hypothetical protein